MRRIVLGLIAVLCFAPPAMAINCSTYPYTLTNGTPADANQVMANFNLIRDCANSSLAHNGVNSDITSLTGLSTPFAVLATNSFTGNQIITSAGGLFRTESDTGGVVVSNTALTSNALKMLTVLGLTGAGSASNGALGSDGTLSFYTNGNTGSTPDATLNSGAFAISGALTVGAVSTTRTNLGLGSLAVQNVTYSNSAPSGSANNGDLWIQY